MSSACCEWNDRLKAVLGKIGEFLNKLWDCLVGTLVAILSFLPRVIKKYWDKLRSSLVKKGAKRVPCPCKCANKPDKPVAKAKPCSRSKLPLVPPSDKSSSCFLGDEVFVQPAKDRATKTTAAQAARNGMRMGTHRDKLGRWSTTEEGVIVPETTREISMFLDYGSSTVDVKLLRSLDWIDENEAYDEFVVLKGHTLVSFLLALALAAPSAGILFQMPFSENWLANGLRFDLLDS